MACSFQKANRALTASAWRLKRSTRRKRVNSPWESFDGELALPHVVDRYRAPLDERAGALMAAHLTLHLDCLELDELLGTQVHGLAVGIVRIGARGLRRHTLVLGELLLS